MASSDSTPDGDSGKKQVEASTPAVPQPESDPKNKKSVQDKILDILRSGSDKRVIALHGEAGVGKTWLARKISKEARTLKITDSNDPIIFGEALWLSLNKKYHEDPMTRDKFLLQDLARQLSVLPPIEGGFEDGDDGGDEDKNEENEWLKEMGSLKKPIWEELEKMTKSAAGGPGRSVLLVLDGVPETVAYVRAVILYQLLDLKTKEQDPKTKEQDPKTKEDQPLDLKTKEDQRLDLKTKEEQLLNLKTKEEQLLDLETKAGVRLRVLVTRRSGGVGVGVGVGVDESERLGYAVFRVEPLGKLEFVTLVKEVGEEEGLQESESVAESFKKDVFEAGGGASSGGGVSLPAAVAVLVVKALKHNFKDGAARMAALDAALKEAAGAARAATLARFACFDTLPSCEDGVLAECCWHCRKFFGLDDNRSVHYNELIAHWILEGYLDCGGAAESSVAEAYEKGFRVFRELLKRGVLKVQEDEDFVSMEWLALEVEDRRIVGFYEKAMLGLPCAFFEDDKHWPSAWNGFGKIAVADGMIKSICRLKKWEKVSTLFIDGDRLSHKVADTFFEPTKNMLETLVVPNPRLKTLEFIGKLSKLSMLVLRGCDMLENVDTIRELSLLTVLEISGAKSLTRIENDVFEKMSQLRSLNLAASHLESLPSSLAKLSELRWLVLKGCSRLTQIPSMKAFTKLEVLDVSGACSWTIFRDKDLGKLEKLKVMDFSQARISPLPYVHSLTSLTRLSLKGCVEITRLPMLDNLKDLQVLEVPGAKKLKEFYNPCLENKTALRILDLSGSEITHLPQSFKNLPKLEFLNLSQMPLLSDFSNVSFEHFKSLESLNLSNTNAKSLPSLSGLGRLRELLLSDCHHLEELPEMKELTSLEVLDLSRAHKLKKIPDQELKASSLRQLLLPDCKKLEKIPKLTDPGKLEVLNLSGCEALADIETQPFQKMTQLETLDLSATKVPKLTSLSSPSKLRQLLLEKCAELSEIPSLETLSELEELNLCGAKSLQKLEAKNLQDKSKLRILNLSETAITALSVDFTKCPNLKELSLRGCFFSELKPQLEKLTSLEVLDLSQTSVAPQNPENPSEVGSKNSLLDLQDFSALQRLSSLTSLHLWGFRVKTFPYWISKLVNLTSLRLPDLNEVQVLDWAQIKRLPDNLNWEECRIFEINASTKPPSRPSISVKGAKMFEALKKNPDAWGKQFAEFRIYICPLAGSDKDDDVYRLREEAFFEKIYLKTISCPDDCKRFLEVRGFENLPEGLGEDVLKRVECISFIEDDFITDLSDLGVGNLEAMRGLWLQKCEKTERVFSAEKDIKFGNGRFNILWASNMPALKELYSGAVKSESFKNLTHLYLDCCPMIEYVFSSPQLPENLEKLEAKFCVRLKALFKCEASEKRDLPNLSRLYLLELPELTEIGIKFTCPQLQAKVRGCPKLEKEKFEASLGEQGKKVAYFEENWEGEAIKVTKE